MTQVRADATVYLTPDGKFTVQVTGLPPFAETRVYTLAARDDNTAAFEGLRLFVEEMEQAHGVTRGPCSDEPQAGGA